jgi:SAM-dependent methyltransferase
MMHNKDVNTRWANIALKYNQYRLSPPTELIQWLVGMACGNKNPGLVVDIGCGTGLSTKPWASFAHKVIGIDPSDELLAVARSHNHHDQISYIKGFGSNTGLKEHSADIATAMHSIHWMEPKLTLAEIKRVLKDHSTLIIYAHGLSPTSKCIALDHELFVLKSNIGALTKKHHIEQDILYFHNSDFAQYVCESNHFEYYRYFNYTEKIYWDIENYLGWIFTLGNVQKLITDFGLSEDEIGLTRFKEIIEKYFNSKKHPLLINWKVFIFQNPIRN